MGSTEAFKTRTFFGTAAHTVAWTLRGLAWITIHYGLWLFDRVFEYLWYPMAIIEFGPFAGTALMMFASFAVCLVLLLGYDRVSTNWFRDALGYEMVKEVAGSTEKALLNPEFPKLLIGLKQATYAGPGMVVVVPWGVLALILGIIFFPLRVILYALRRYFLRPLWLWLPWLRPTLVFLYLSLVFDPMTCTVLMRPNSKHTMDWGIGPSSSAASFFRTLHGD